MRGYSNGKVSMLEVEEISDSLRAQNMMELAYYRKSSKLSLETKLEDWRHRLIGLNASL